MSVGKNLFNQQKNGKVFQRSKTCVSLRSRVVTSTPLKPSAASLSFSVSPIVNPLLGRTNAVVQQPTTCRLPAPTLKITSQIPQARRIPSVAAKVGSHLPVKKNIVAAKKYPSLLADESVIPAPQAETRKQVGAVGVKSFPNVVKGRKELAPKSQPLNETILIDTQHTLPQNEKSRKGTVDKTTVHDSKNAKGENFNETVIIEKNIKGVEVDQNILEVGPRRNRCGKPSLKAANKIKEPVNNQTFEAENHTEVGPNVSVKKKRKGTDSQLDKKEKKNESKCELINAESNKELKQNSSQVKTHELKLKNEFNESSAESNGHDSMPEERVARQKAKKGSKELKVIEEAEVIMSSENKSSISRRGATKSSKLAAVSAPTDDSESKKIVENAGAVTNSENKSSKGRRGATKSAKSAAVSTPTEDSESKKIVENAEVVTNSENKLATSRRGATKSAKSAAVSVPTEDSESKKIVEDAEVITNSKNKPSTSRRRATKSSGLAAVSAPTDANESKKIVENAEVVTNSKNKPSKSRRGATKSDKSAAVSATTNDGESQKSANSVDLQEEEPECKAPVKHTRKKPAGIAAQVEAVATVCHQVNNFTESKENMKQSKPVKEEAHTKEKVSKRKITKNAKASQAETNESVAVIVEEPESEYEVPVKRSKRNPAVAPTVVMVEEAKSEYEVPVKRSRRKSPDVAPAIQTSVEQQGKLHRTSETLIKSIGNDEKIGSFIIAVDNPESVSEPGHVSNTRAKESEVRVPFKNTNRQVSVKSLSNGASNSMLRKQKSTKVKPASVTSLDGKHETENVVEPSSRNAIKTEVEKEDRLQVKASKRISLKRKNNAVEDSVNHTSKLVEPITKNMKEDAGVSRPKRVWKCEDTVQSQRNSLKTLDMPRSRSMRISRRKNISIISPSKKEHDAKSNPESSSCDQCSSSVPKIKVTAPKHSQVDEDSSSDPEKCSTNIALPNNFDSFLVSNGRKLSEFGQFWNHKTKHQLLGDKDPSKAYSVLMLFAHDYCGVQCGILEIPVGVHKRKTTHDSYDIMLTVLSGCGVFKINSNKILMNGGELCIVTKGSFYAINNVGDVPLRMTVLKLPCK